MIEQPRLPRPQRLNRPGRKLERNKAIVDAIRAGMRKAQLARIYGISRQRVQQVWEEYGG